MNTDYSTYWAVHHAHALEHYTEQLKRAHAERDTEAAEAQRQRLRVDCAERHVTELELQLVTNHMLRNGGRHGSESAPILQIRAVGGMWRVLHGRTTLAFCTSYARALAREEELRAEGAAERMAWRKEKTAETQLTFSMTHRRAP